MPSVKLSITCRKALTAKYKAPALKRLDAAIAAWIKADKARGITTIHIAVDDSTAMRGYKVAPVTGTVTPNKVKKALDSLVAKLSPDYVVLFGAGDVVPPFVVPNPSAAEDAEATVPTDNPYASSRNFSVGTRASYLIPDRVVGRIPDVPRSGDPSWVIDYLGVAASWQSSSRSKYASAMLICCDAWKKAGEECVRFFATGALKLMISPPAADTSATIRKKHSAPIHMIKCHGAESDSRFYGQKGQSYPPVLRSTSLLKRTKVGTVAGAMCCFGANVFDPDDQRNVTPGDPPIPSVYLRQGAYGFLGSTTTAWVGDETMMCADWIVAGFLKSVLGGASLGRATLESKQDFVRWTQQQGHELDSAEEKTLLQFVLLGDPSIHPVKAAAPAGVVAASLPAAASSGAMTARHARRAARRELGAMLRAVMPSVTHVSSTHVPPTIAAVMRRLAGKQRKGQRLSAPRIERRVRPVAFEAPGPVSAGPVLAGPGIERSNLQYYWATAPKTGPVRDIRVVSIQADPQGSVLRTHVLVSS